MFRIPFYFFGEADGAESSRTSGFEARTGAEDTFAKLEIWGQCESHTSTRIIS